MNATSQYEDRLPIRPNQWKLSGSLALLLFLPVVGWAGGVVTNCTETGLRAAMAGGGTVTFACDGTILLANTITNTLNLTLDGSGHQVTLSGNYAARVFLVDTNVTLQMLNLTIANGASPGGSAILNLGGTVNVTGVSFLSNTARPVYGSRGPPGERRGHLELRRDAPGQ